MANTEAFDFLSERYDSWFVEHESLFKVELQAIQSVWPKGQQNALEVGVGSGVFAQALGVHIGVEPSENMAKKARARGIVVVKGVAESLPFKNQQFDIVLFVTTLCFVDELSVALSEAYRVLKPGASVITAIIDKDSELGKQYESKKANSAFYKQASFLNTDDLLFALKKSGFSVKDIKQTVFVGKDDHTVASGYGKGAFVVVKAVR